MENSKIIDTVMIPLSRIKTNEGQIDGVPANPRTLVGDRFDRLCKSIKDNPEMLGMRELLVWEQDGEYITIGGNMRLQALRYLRHEEAPCKVIPSDTSVEQLCAYVIKDNVNYGEWADDELKEDWADVAELGDWGVEEDLTAADAEGTDAGEEEEKKTLTFTLSSEQFKFVKQKLNKVDESDNGNAILILIEDYERENDNEES